jgi:DNA-binding transcriptional LysR family regulator
MTSDYIMSVLVNPIVAKLQRISPGIGMDVRLTEESVDSEFERGEIDLTLVPKSFLSDKHPAELLFKETYVVVGARENPAFDEEITVETFFDLSHIAVTLGPSQLPSFAEHNLARLGSTRKVDIYAPYFSAVPWMLLGTNRIAVIQERLARTFMSIMPLKIAPMPMEFPLMHVMMQYHSARVADQGQTWLRKLLLAAATDAVTDNQQDE